MIGERFTFPGDYYFQKINFVQIGNIVEIDM